jgi:hypothetical protein
MIHTFAHMMQVAHRLRSQGKLFLELRISKLDNGELRLVQYILVNAGVWESTPFDSLLNLPADTFSWIGPSGPDRPRILDAISNVQQGMYCERAGSEAIRIALVIESNRVFSISSK